MMLRRTTILLLLASSFSWAAFGQSASDTLTFAKGRSITSLFGSIDNQRVNFAGGSVATTAYTIGTKSGKFIKNNWTLGLNFSLSRGNFENLKNSTTNEALFIGLWSRIYFADSKSLALYGELTPLVTSIYNVTTVRDGAGNLITDEVVSGGGFGIEPGFGFVYVISRNVGFGMTLSYTFADLNVDVEDRILGSTRPENLMVNQLRFSFNFQVYLDQFFF